MAQSRSTRVVLFSVLVAVLVAGLLTAVGILGFPSTANANELYLEASEDVGANPFAPAAGPKSPVSSPPRQAGAGAGVNLESPAPACDAAALVATLQSDARLATAWTDALNTDATLRWSGGDKVRPDQIAAYVAELAPQVLAKDVRVTNFQYTRGAPTSVQSVLQTGSSVLVDKVGVVRVRCKCGNPLTPMKRLTAKPAYQGKPWAGFVDIDIIVVHKCGENQYWNGRECRDIDCKNGYYYDGGACRPIECADDEYLKDGYCRPKKCDDGEVRTNDGRGCQPDKCKDGENFDGHKCEPPKCDKGEVPAGRDCQPPDCGDKKFEPGKGCVEPDCPPDKPTRTASGCMPDKDTCDPAAKTVSDACMPTCDPGFTPSKDGKCTAEEQTNLPECGPQDSAKPECASATKQLNTNPSTTGAPPAATTGQDANTTSTTGQDTATTGQDTATTGPDTATTGPDANTTSTTSQDGTVTNPTTGSTTTTTTTTGDPGVTTATPPVAPQGPAVEPCLTAPIPVPATDPRCPSPFAGPPSGTTAGPQGGTTAGPPAGTTAGPQDTTTADQQQNTTDQQGGNGQTGSSGNSGSNKKKNNGTTNNNGTNNSNNTGSSSHSNNTGG